MKSLAQLIRETKGRFFHVSFIKRTDGSRREMVARLGVSKNIVGTGGLKFEPSEHNLMTVFCMQKKQYRMIPLDAVLSFRCGNQKWSAA